MHREIFSVLAQAGQVKLLRLPKDKQTGQHRSYGFCEYYDIAAAQHAITHLRDARVNGKRLKVAAFIQGDARQSNQASTSQGHGSQAVAKRGRSSSSDADLQAKQRPCTHRHQPSLSASSAQAYVQTLRQTQHQSHAPQTLNLCNTSACTVDLTDHPTSNTLLRTWVQREQDTCLFNVRLIGDMDYPDQHVGVGLADLLSHSLWARISYDRKDDMKTFDWTSGGPVHVAVPVRTSPDAVRKVVQALYGGTIHLGDDAEEVLILASAMQIEVVTEACIRFLLQPDQLTSQQLAELYLRTCHLNSAESQQQALQLLVSMPWTQPVYDALRDVFKPLLQTQPELCRKLLLNGASGHMCGIQVCDLLMACGLSTQDSLLPQLLQFSDFESGEMRCLKSLVQQDVKAASRELLEACVLHNGRSWLCFKALQRPVSRCTRLISTGVARRNQEVLKFRCLNGHSKTYLLTMPDAESSMRCTLSLMDGKIGEGLQRVGLYLLQHQAPFVTPLTSQAVNSNTTEVLFPFTGRDFGVAVRDTCLVDLGLYTQHV